MINISVQNPEDALIDAKVVNASSTVLKRSAQALDTNLLSFTAEEYCKNAVSLWVFLSYSSYFILKYINILTHVCVFDLHLITEPVDTYSRTSAVRNCHAFVFLIFYHH